MSNEALGRLERVDLRAVWEREANHFTPWLAMPDNLDLLSQAIGIDLELEAQEKDVGPFRADILCKDTSDNSWVLIENQLERTDHTHLGQLITYAAGLQAATIVWVAQRITEEHRAALDWLNEITGEKFSFFGLEVELWRIGNSPIAPKFNIVCKPNDWSKTFSESAARLESGELSGIRQLQLEYWTELWNYLEASKSSLRGTKPRPQQWNNFSIGRSNFGISTVINSYEPRIAVHMWMGGSNSKTFYQRLLMQRSEIDTAFGEGLEWEELPDRKESRIAARLVPADFKDKSDWPRQHQWLKATTERLFDIFSPRIRSITI